MQRSIGLVSSGAGLWRNASRTRFSQLLLLGGWLFGVLQAGVGPGSKFVLELLNTACGVHELKFPGVERVADVTDVDLELFTRAARDKAIAAAARDLGLEILGMDAVFHDRSLWNGGWSGYNPFGTKGYSGWSAQSNSKTWARNLAGILAGSWHNRHNRYAGGAGGRV
jgi:hypothetical protein